MLNWWATLDARGRFFFVSALCFVIAIVVYFATDRTVNPVGLIASGFINLLIGMFCPKDDSTKM
jgi:p-aminobenzoyl-glutamate transporter AbgT